MNRLNFLIQLITNFILLNFSLNDCNERSYPIFISSNETCEMKFCTEEEFDNNVCVKDNEIIRVQWLNNIIKLGPIKCRNSKLAKFQDGSIAIFTGEKKKTPIFLIYNFYILKENGREFSIIQVFYTPEGYGGLSTSAHGDLSSNIDEGEMLVIKIKNNEEIVFNVGKLLEYTELYDLTNKKIYLVQTKDFFKNYTFTNIRGSLFNLRDSKLFVYAGLVLTYQDSWNNVIPSSNISELALFRIEINEKDYFKYTTYSRVSNKFAAYGKMVSCFQTEKKTIVCFYISSLDNKEYKIITFNEYLDKKAEELTISVSYIDENIFFKCIHYDGEEGIFLYYNETYNKIYPNINFKIIKDGSIKDKEGFSEFQFSESFIYDFDYNLDLNLNDFMMISKEIICFCSVSKKKETLYIIILNIFEHAVEIRYYVVETFGLYNYKFFMDLRTDIYKGNIIMTSSFCEQSNCENLNNSYTSLIIFNYPNSTDANKDITEVLFDENAISFENLNYNFDLKDYIIIENNIFGYIYSSIVIKSFQDCDNIKLISSTKNTEITAEYKLLEDESINITLSKTDFNLFNCSIGYIFEITESNYSTNIQYPISTDTFDENGEMEELFNNKKKTYSGRLSYYNIYLKDSLTKNCLDNCGLCYDDSEKKCISCKFNYTSEDHEDGKRQKICLNGSEAELTEKLTEEVLTEQITGKLENNNKSQELAEEIITNEKTKITENEDLYTSKITEIPTFDVNNHSMSDIIDTKYYSQTDIRANTQSDSQGNSQTDNKSDSTIDTGALTDMQKDRVSDSQISEDNLFPTNYLSYSVKDISTNSQIDNLTNTKNNIDYGTNTQIEIDTIINKLTGITTEVATEFFNNKSTERLSSNLMSDINIGKRTNKITEIIEEERIKKDCTNEEIIASKCTWGTVSKEQFQSLHQQIKHEILNNETYHGENRIIITDNIAFQITKIDNQTNEYSNLSSVDLGECEEKLIKKYSVPEGETLIIYKTDIKSDNLITKYILYEIYHPITLKKLELKECLEDTIRISVPVNFNEDTLDLIESLNNSGYNVFNSSDSFYNDICAPYTTLNGTDINMNDRQHIIEHTGGSLDLCQVGCHITYFNSSTHKVICDCDLKKTPIIENINEIQFSSNLMNNLLIQLKYSNYLVLRCYKLLKAFNNLRLNFGFLFMSIIIISLIILMIIYLIKGKKKLQFYFEAILKNKLIYVNNRKSLKKNVFIDKSDKKLNEFEEPHHRKHKNHKQKEKPKRKEKEKNNKIHSVKNKKENEKEKSILKKIESNNGPPIRKNGRKSKTKKLGFIDKSSKLLGSTASSKNLFKTSEHLTKNEIKNLNVNIIPINHLNYKKSKKIKVVKAKIENKISSKSNSKNEVDIFKLKDKNVSEKNLALRKTAKSKKILDTDYKNYQTLNISELNYLEYQEALLIDKRTYFQYYGSLIRKRHPIIFTFVPIDDYNLVSLKIALFLLSLSSFFVINAFFFSDKTMHKIYVDNGYSDFLVHLPEIIYSSIISAVIDTILKLLCLSESKILSLKELKKVKETQKRIKDAKTYLRIKFIFFFLVGFLLSIFYCYFMSCFCVVYKNTQIILLKDSFISYGLSLLYPFGLCLIPGIFRIFALRTENKDKISIYKFSQLISFV